MAPKGASSTKKKTAQAGPKNTAEAIVAYHADTLAVVLTVFILMFMWPITEPISAPIIKPSHNISYYDASDPDSQTLYVSGPADFFFTLFQAVVFIIIHDVGKDLVWERLANRIKAQRVLKGEFWFQGTYFVFRLFSLWWGFGLISQDKLTSASLWEDYPHPMSLWTKIFAIMQLAYWVHTVPSLVIIQMQLKKIAKVPYRRPAVSKLLWIALNFAWLFIAYTFNFTRLLVVVATLDSLPELVRTVLWAVDTAVQMRPTPKKQWFTETNSLSLNGIRNILVSIHTATQFLCKAAIIGVSAYVLLVVMPTLDSNPKESLTDFNNPVIRLVVLGAIVLAQVQAVFRGKVTKASAAEDDDDHEE